MYDIIIIGGGPAGLTAAIYAQRAGKKCAVFEKDLCGGMINNSAKVENIPGFSEISGPDFAQNLTDQAEKCGAEIIYEEVAHVIRYEGLEYQFCVVTTDDKHYKAKAVILATGTKHRTLGLEHEEDFIGNGIHFCALCDGAFYKDKNVIVVGGGNSALTEALYLSKICNHVTIIQNLPYLTGDKVLQDQIAKVNDPSIKSVAINGQIISTAREDVISIKLEKAIKDYIISDENKLIGLMLEDGAVLSDGIFLCIGLNPYKDITDGLIQYDERGFMSSSNCPGIFFAGDCEVSDVKQVVTACASGAKAATAACNFIK